MERALCETVDITFDYSGAEAEDTEGWVCLISTMAERLQLRTCDLVAQGSSPALTAGVEVNFSVHLQSFASKNFFH